VGLPRFGLELLGARLLGPAQAGQDIGGSLAVGYTPVAEGPGELAQVPCRAGLAAILQRVDGGDKILARDFRDVLAHELFQSTAQPA
jgi:hypothetical protein